jgi:hypothetical protein
MAKKEEINPMLGWSKEQKLDHLVETLKEKVIQWRSYQSYDYCHCDEGCSCINPCEGERAYETASDDVEWALRSLGLL